MRGVGIDSDTLVNDEDDDDDQNHDHDHILVNDACSPVNCAKCMLHFIYLFIYQLLQVFIESLCQK